MMNLIRIALFWTVLSVTPLSFSADAIAGDDQPVVVELYTSQGCSSCPPADKYMGELVKRKNVLGLTFHVDYWDYIGWKDPFALPQNTTRQRRHSSNLGLRHIYTPQMVIHGAINAVGSDPMDVEKAIHTAKGFAQVSVNLQHRKDGQLSIAIPTARTKGTSKIYLVAFDDKHTTSIKRGENGGRKLSYYNVVREMKEIGTWSGDAVNLSVPLKGMMQSGRSGCAVIVQSNRNGEILGAAQIRLSPSS